MERDIGGKDESAQGKSLVTKRIAVHMAIVALVVGAVLIVLGTAVIWGALELVRSVKDGRTRRYFLREDGSRMLKTQFLGKIESRVFRVLNEKGPLSGIEVAKELSISRQRAHYNLRHLQKRGFAKLLDSRWHALQQETS